MTGDGVLRFLMNQPFEPFSLFLADGRTLQVEHPEFVNIGRFAASFRLVDKEGRVELIDVGLVVSMRTIKPSDTAFTEVEPENLDEG